MLDILLIVAAAFGSGVLNTLAGGVPHAPGARRGRDAAGRGERDQCRRRFPGYLGGAIGFGHEIRTFGRPLLTRMTLWTRAGG